MLGIRPIAVPQLDIGGVGKVAFCHIQAFARVDGRAEGLGKAVVDPVLGIRAVTIKQLNIFAVIGLRQAQVQALVRVGLQFDRAAVKGEILGWMILTFAQLDIGTVGDVVISDIQAFVGSRDHADVLIRCGGHGRSYTVYDPLLVRFLIAVHTIVELDIGTARGIAINQVEAFVEIYFGPDHLVGHIVDPVLRIGAVAVPQLDVGAIGRITGCQINTFAEVFAQADIGAVYDPLLGRIPFALNQLNIGAFGGIAVRQVNTFGLIFSQMDRFEGKSIGVVAAHITILWVGGRTKALE